MASCKPFPETLVTILQRLAGWMAVRLELILFYCICKNYKYNLNLFNNIINDIKYWYIERVGAMGVVIRLL